MVKMRNFKIILVMRAVTAGTKAECAYKFHAKCGNLGRSADTGPHREIWRPGTNLSLGPYSIPRDFLSSKILEVMCSFRD